MVSPLTTLLRFSPFCLPPKPISLLSLFHYKTNRHLKLITKEKQKKSTKEINTENTYRCRGIHFHIKESHESILLEATVHMQRTCKNNKTNKSKEIVTRHYGTKHLQICPWVLFCVDHHWWAWGLPLEWFYIKGDLLEETYFFICKWLFVGNLRVIDEGLCPFPFWNWFPIWTSPVQILFMLLLSLWVCVLTDSAMFRRSYFLRVLCPLSYNFFASLSSGFSEHRGRIW